MSTILVVDDDPELRLLVRWVLEDVGHEVIEAAHGTAALDLISTHRLPDVVVTDLMMPVHDGATLIAHLRSAAATAAIPIVLVTGNTLEARTLQASGLVAAVVPKPFDAAMLALCIQAVAESSTSRGRLTA